MTLTALQETIAVECHGGEATGITGTEIRELCRISLQRAHKEARQLVDLGVRLETQWLRIRGEWVERGEIDNDKKVPRASIVYIHVDHRHFYDDPELE